MIIRYHKRFLKHFKQRIVSNLSLDRKYTKRLQLFLSDPKQALLNDHALHGDLEGYRSFSVTGDIRVVYRYEDENIKFYDIGTHNQVY